MEASNFKALLDQASQYAAGLKERLDANTAQMESLATERKAILAEMDEFKGVAGSLKAATTRPRKAKDTAEGAEQTPVDPNAPKKRRGRPAKNAAQSTEATV